MTNSALSTGDLAENIWKFSEYLGWKDSLKDLMDKSEESFIKVKAISMIISMKFTVLKIHIFYLIAVKFKRTHFV